MVQTLTIALAQVPHSEDPLPIIAEAAARKADIVAFPEMWSNGYSGFDESDERAKQAWIRTAIDLDHPYVSNFREAAKTHAIHVVTTLLEKDEDKLYNTALLIDPKGDILLLHRKVHICFFDAPEMVLDQGKTFDVATIEAADGQVNIGLMICMDREYAESAAALSAKGCEIALVPNASDLVTCSDVGDVRVAQTRGRAFETVMGIAVINYPAPRFDGNSFAVGSIGQMLTQAGRDREIVFTTFDLDEIRKHRKADWFRWRSP